MATVTNIRKDRLARGGARMPEAKTASTTPELRLNDDGLRAQLRESEHWRRKATAFADDMTYQLAAEQNAHNAANARVARLERQLASAHRELVPLTDAEIAEVVEAWACTPYPLREYKSVFEKQDAGFTQLAEMAALAQREKVR